MLLLKAGASGLADKQSRDRKRRREPAEHLLGGGLERASHCKREKINN